MANSVITISHTAVRLKTFHIIFTGVSASLWRRLCILLAFSLSITLASLSGVASVVREQAARDMLQPAAAPSRLSRMPSNTGVADGVPNLGVTALHFALLRRRPSSFFWKQDSHSMSSVARCSTSLYSFLQLQ
jgi:hypothetical protein